MSRRNSLLDDLMTLGAKMPWQAGVIAASVSFLFLHLAAVHLAPAAGSPLGTSEMGPVLQRQLFSTVARILQYVVPVALLIGAAVSFWRRVHSVSLYRRTQGGGANALDAMSSAEFEMLVGEAFRRIGFAVMDNPVGGPDGGVDLVLRKDAKKFLVQCKQWRTAAVGVAVVRELFGVVSARGAAGGYVVSTGTFTPDAISFAARTATTLIGGHQLVEMIGDLRVSDVTEKRRLSSALQRASAPDTAPSCPRCGGTMVRRMAKRGPKAGSEFWGCQGFPNCRGTR